MAKSAHARTIAAHVPNEICDLIVARANGINVPESRYIRMILEKWVAEGCPAVSPLDATAQRVAPRKHTA